MTRTLKKTLVVLLSVCAALVMCLGVFSLTACKKKGNTEPKLYTLTFESNGGSEVNPITAKAGDAITPPEDPSRDEYTFAGWYLTEDFSGDEATVPSVMPAEDRTYYANWDPVPALEFQVKVFKLDFATYEEYVEDVSLAKTVKKEVGSVVTGEQFVPEHFELKRLQLGEEVVTSFEVPESGNFVLSVYVDPVYTDYSDVFESTDLIFALEAEPNVLYLDRIELGRKLSTEFNPSTGYFKFETDGDFVLEGKISGDHFYYYRDTVAKKFADYAGTDATLEIKSANEVVYTNLKGVALTGSYEVNVETGRYVFTSGNTEFEFVLVTYYGVLFFRTSDGLEGYYAYDGEFEDGGWALLHFDSFGTLTYIEDTGTTATADYDALGDGIVDMYDLGIAKLVEQNHESLGGYDVKGVFSFADDLRGEFTRTVGYRTDILTLDGFGGAKYSAYGEGGDLLNDYSFVGTYELVRDDSWLVKSYSSLIGSYTSNYTGMNSCLKFTAEDATVKNYMLYYTMDMAGNTIPSKFEEYKEDYLDIKPGRHDITGEHIIFEGTTYVLDENHEAFLYFKNYNYNGGSYQAVQLWYGTKNSDGNFVYELFIAAAWYNYGNEVYVPGDYDGMYFNAMAEDGTFAFDYEDYDGEVEEFVFLNDESGKLYIDAAGVAYYKPADGEATTVTYTTIGSGLLYIVEFAGLPEGVSQLFAVYDDIWAWNSTEETYIYDISADGSVIYIAYADSEEGGDVQLVITDDYTFLGVTATDTDGNSLIEYIFAGETAPVAGSDDEFTFVWNDEIYYDMLDYYDDVDLIIEIFSDFQFKVVDNIFYVSDGYVVELTNGEDVFETDGYGFATLTVGGKTMNGTYYVVYSLVEFTSNEGETYILKPDEVENPTTFTVVDLDSEDVDLYIGVYYETYLYDGEPAGLLSDTLFLDGMGSFYYSDVVYADDYFSYEVFNYYGDYEFVRENNTYTQGLSGAVAAAFEFKLTFSEDDVRNVLILFYDITGEGDYYGFFVTQNETLLGDYTAYTDDGEVLGELLCGDGFKDEGALFVGEDENGEFAYEGYMARGFIEDKFYDVNPKFTEDIEGNVIVFVAYDEEGYMTDQFVFDIDEQNPTKVVYRSMFYGTVAEYDTATRFSGNYMYLDGHGNATLYDESGSVVASGEYKPAKEINEDAYLFVGGGQKFAFMPTYSASEAAISYYYTKYTEDDDGIYVNDDWALLWLNGFGTATYINKYGVVYHGEYYTMVEDEDSVVYCMRVELSTTKFFFEITNEGDFHELEGEFLIRGGVLYAYFGSDEEITIPDSVTEIAAGAFALAGANNITKINFNNVTKIHDEAFFHATSLVELVSDKITYIGKHAFDHIYTLTKVELGAIVTIDEYAFYGCVYLNEIKLGGTVQTIKAYAFSRSVAALGDDPDPVTLDLTAVADPTAIDLSIFAFQAEQGWMGLTDKLIFTKGSKILVSGDVEMLNNILSCENFKKTVHITVQRPTATEEVDWTVDLVQFVQLALTENPVADKTYYNLENDVIYTFVDGSLVKYTFDGSYSYDKATVGTYYVKEGTVYVYSFNGTSYVVNVNFAVGGNSFEINGLNVYEAGQATTVNYTVADKQLSITYNASVSFNYGASVSLSVSAVNYDGNDGTSISFSKSSGVLNFNANSHSFTATLASGAWTVVDNGVELELYDKTNSSIWFKAVFTVADNGEVTLKSLGYNTYTESYPDYYSGVDNLTKVDDENKWTFTANKGLYSLEYVAEHDSEPAGIVIVNNGYSLKDSGYNYTIALKINESDDTITEITDFADYYGNSYAIVGEIEYSEDHKSATLTTENDGTFILRLEPYYSSYIIYVTRTNYEYEDTIYDSGYDYKVKITIKVDEEGVKKIFAFTSFMDYYSTVIEVSDSSIDADGVLHLTLADGRTADITLNTSSSYLRINIVWGTAAE